MFWKLQVCSESLAWDSGPFNCFMNPLKGHQCINPSNGQHLGHRLWSSLYYMCKIKESSEPAYSFFCLKWSSKKCIKLTLTWQFHVSHLPCAPVPCLLCSACRTKHLALLAENKVKVTLALAMNFYFSQPQCLSLNVQTEKLTGTGKAVIILIQFTFDLKFSGFIAC